jgi:hypothetical protein
MIIKKKIDILSSEIIFILSLSFIKVIIQLLTNGQYGYFRDEFYYIACGEHPALGYVDHPPFTPMVANLSRLIFGETLFGIRFFPAIAGGLNVLFSGLITKVLGGNIFSQIFTCIVMIAAPGFLATNLLFTTNAFDQLFWTLCIYNVVLVIKNDNPKYWLLLGLFAGLGLMNKPSILFLTFSLAAGLVITKNREYFTSKWLWFGGIIALIIFLPNIIWQAANKFPTLEFLKNVRLYKNFPTPPLDFVIGQIVFMNPLSFPVWILGLIYLFFDREGKKYNIFGIVYLILFLVMIFQNGKDYYLAPVYPVIIAAGSIFLINILSKFKLKFLLPVYTAFIISVAVISSPYVLPVLPPEKFIEYENFMKFKPMKSENQEIAELPQFYADMFGWENLVQKVAADYNKLSIDEKKECVILTSNYGEAAAIDFYGGKYNLPKAISGHNNYYLWGPGGKTGDVTILVKPNQKQEELNQFFNEVKKGEFITSKYTIPYEKNFYLYICKGIKVNIKDAWPTLKSYM